MTAHAPTDCATSFYLNLEICTLMFIYAHLEFILIDFDLADCMLIMLLLQVIIQSSVSEFFCFLESLSVSL